MAKIGLVGIAGITLATGIVVMLIDHSAIFSGGEMTFAMLGSFLEGTLLSLAFFFVICGGIFGLIIRQVLDRDLFTSLLATFGVAIVMEQMMNIVFGSDTQAINLGYDSLRLFDGAISVGVQKVAAFVLACVLAAGVVLFMKRSRMGQAIRATAQNPRAAKVMGIDTDKVYSFTFCLNAAICGASGALIAMIWLIQPFYGIPYSIRAFVIVTAAGLGNLPGVIAAGFGIGVVEQFGGFVLGAAYQQAIVVGLLLVVLLIRMILRSRQRQVVE
jgi:branched-chain amino acid transport system permease protein